MHGLRLYTFPLGSTGLSQTIRHTLLAQKENTRFTTPLVLLTLPCDCTAYDRQDKIQDDFEMAGIAWNDNPMTKSVSLQHTFTKW